MKLYELSEQLRGLMALEDVPEEALQDTLEALTGEIQEKAENICHVLANSDSDVAALDQEIKRLQARKRVITNNKERLKDYLRHNMQACDIQKISSSLFTVSLIKPQPIVVVDDEESLPEDYRKITVSADKTLIKKALKDGYPVPGAHLEDGKAGIRIS